jgi:ribose-phosphate pyrophosphokinase
METLTTINIERQIGVETFLYPDNQPHVRLHTAVCGQHVRVVHPVRSSLELVQLLCLSNALDQAGAVKKELVIPYLMGARSDRYMLPGDSCELKVVADAINSCNFERVNLFDVHSDVATLLIKRCKNHNNSRLVKAYGKDDAVLIVPDAGAAKKAEKYAGWNANITSSVQCVKTRDFENGLVTLRVINAQACKDKNCVIIDDICDGGATFLAIAKEVRHYAKHLTLIVSHGIFSKGMRALEAVFDEIIMSDSYQPNVNDATKLTVIQLNL